MKLGVYIHGSSPFKPKESYDEYVRLTKLYENMGIDTLWFADHLIRTPDPNQSGLFETWSLIAALAAITHKVRFGTMVTPVTFRNLGLFAKIVSTIDHISNGRITVGLGTGWYTREHSMFDLSYPDLKSRFTLLEDHLRALIQLWTTTKPLDFKSESFTLHKAYLNPQPIQSPHPPILIGGSGEKKTLKLVAKYAQMSNFGGDFETIAHKLSVLENHCNEVGSNFADIETTTNMATIIGLNEDQVKQGVQNYRKRFVDLGMMAPPADSFDDNRLVGTPEKIIERINQLESLGIKAINMTINDEQSEKYLANLIDKYKT